MELIIKHRRFIIIHTGDWNAVLGEGKEETHMGHYGLGSRNACGEIGRVL